MRRKKALKAFMQGDCNGLCGLYALLNACQLMHAHRIAEDADLVMAGFFMALEEKRNAANIMLNGVGLQEIIHIIHRFLMPNYKIKYRRLFAKRANVSLPEYWWSCEKFLRQEKHSAVIAAFENWGTMHWTTIGKMTSKTMSVLDSGPKQLEAIHREQCSMHGSLTQMKYSFLPTRTIFLSKGETK